MGNEEVAAVFSPGAVVAVLMLFCLTQPVSPTPGPMILTALIAAWISRRTSLAGKWAVRWLMT